MKPSEKKPINPGYETTDVQSRPILYFLLIILALLVVTAFAMGAFYAFLEKQDLKNQTPSAVFANQPLAKPDIILATTPSTFLQQYNAETQKLMTSYAWMDPDKQIIRVPIEVAMKNLLKKSENLTPEKKETV